MKKILIFKHGSLGDITLALPAFAAIRKHFNESKITLLTERQYYSFFKRCPYIDKFIEDNRKENFLIKLFKIKKLFDHRFDLIIDLQNSKRTSVYNFLFRIFQSTKISSSRPFSHFRYYIPKQGVENVSTGLFNQLKILGISEIKDINYYWLEKKIKENFNKPLALFIPGVSKKGHYKQWQPEKFAKVARYLENLNLAICIIGNKEDQKSALPIISSCKNVINKIENSPPEVIYSLALKSKIIFSNDTGPGHIASLAKKNFIWIVNDNNISKANLPLGKHIYKIGANSVKNISYERIINFIEENKLI